MPSFEQHDDVLRRLQTIESRLDRVEIKVTDHSISDAEIKADIKSMRLDFAALKTDVLETLEKHTSNSWSLINKGMKIIIGLILVILLIAGFKIAPELLKSLLGGMS